MATQLATSSAQRDIFSKFRSLLLVDRYTAGSWLTCGAGGRGEGEQGRELGAQEAQLAPRLGQALLVEQPAQTGMVSSS